MRSVPVSHNCSSTQVDSLFSSSVRLNPLKLKSEKEKISKLSTSCLIYEYVSFSHVFTCFPHVLLDKWISVLCTQFYVWYTYENLGMEKEKKTAKCFILHQQKDIFRLGQSINGIKETIQWINISAASLLIEAKCKSIYDTPYLFFFFNRNMKKTSQHLLPWIRYSKKQNSLSSGTAATDQGIAETDIKHS